MPGDIRDYRASDGYLLRYRHYAAETPPRAYVVALHGIQSHSGWFEWSSDRLCRAGYDVRFLDRRGSGLNELQRGHAPHWQRLLNDVVQFLRPLHDERDANAPDAPVVLLAVSWSGKLAVTLAARRPELINGLALLYPGIFSQIGPTWWQRLQLRIGEFWQVNHKLIPVPLDDPALFTDQPQWQQYIREDPLALHTVTTGFLYANRQLGELAASSAGGLRCPTLVMLAGRDRIVDNRATRGFFRRIRTPGSRLIEYSRAAHTLEFDADRDTFIHDLIEWLGTIRPESGSPVGVE